MYLLTTQWRLTKRLSFFLLLITPLIFVILYYLISFFNKPIPFFHLYSLSSLFYFNFNSRKLTESLSRFTPPFIISFLDVQGGKVIVSGICSHYSTAVRRRATSDGGETVHEKLWERIVNSSQTPQLTDQSTNKPGNIVYLSSRSKTMVVCAGNDQNAQHWHQTDRQTDTNA